jgi:P-type Mg2+ transporter
MASTNGEDGTVPFWSLPLEHALTRSGSSALGLTPQESQARLARYSKSLLRPERQSGFRLFLHQFSSPIILILIFAATLSFFLHDPADGSIILSIVFISGLLGFWQEHGAANAVRKLFSIVQVKARVLRGGKETDVPVDEVVPGDVVALSAGAIIPGDCLIMESSDLFVDEAAFTGETFPEEKRPGVLPAATPLADRTNTLFMGTHVISGSARALVAAIGRDTEFGKVSERLRLKPDETDFEHGVRHFGYLLMEVTLTLVMAIFAVNVALQRPVLESFLFSLALAVGLTPQLLPAIISINLSHGARKMAKQKVVVKRLASIEDFGSMNVLCSDKTGTITEGKVQVHAALGVDGEASEKTMLYAYLNSSFESGFANPIDDAIRGGFSFDLTGYAKLDEVPYDFQRKRLTVLLEKDGRSLLVTKGALENVLEACTGAEGRSGAASGLEGVRDGILDLFRRFSGEGYRVLGVAYREMEGVREIDTGGEQGLVFLGFLALFDPPKQGIADTIARLERLGISLKMITGDNRLVAAHVGRELGIDGCCVVTGDELAHMSEAALIHRVTAAHIFAEIEPNQKEHIIGALRKAGNVVGFMGDGINDAPALHAADVGVSVEGAVDVAKEAADIVLLEKDLGVLENGVREGRVTFSNTLKYVFMATSANFGNMFSMAGASLFLSYLPLLPGQVLLTNLMTDLPEMNIATDNVDPEMVEQPRRWDIKFIRRFMLVFGSLSSIFDFLTFMVLLWVLKAGMLEFRTGWFVESVISASMIVLVIRTRRPFWRSRPGRALLITTVVVALATIAVPYTGIGKTLGFTPLPAVFYPALLGILILYVAFAELAKHFFYRWMGRERQG